MFLNIFFKILIPFIVYTSAFAVTSNVNALGDIQSLFTVDKISVKGTRKVEPEAILEKISIKEGQKIDNYSLRSAIMSIYGLKYFEKVEAHLEKEGKKNILVFKVVEKPVIRTVSFEGNDEVSRDDLKEQVKTKEYNILDVNTIKKDINLIEKFYEEKGFYLVQVDYELKENENKSLDLIFKIKEFDKVRVKKILFLGNNEITDLELKNNMQTREESLFSGLSGSGNFKDFNFQVDIERIKMLYKSRGYLQVNVGNPAITVSEVSS